MSRSGYTEDYGDDEPGRMNLYRGRVARSFRGKRGQAFLRELAAAMDAMPEKKLGARSFQPNDGEVCTLGCIARARGVDTSALDAELSEAAADCDYEPDMSDDVAALLDIATCMAAEIMFENDDPFYCRIATETPEERWKRMRAQVECWIGGETP